MAIQVYKGLGNWNDESTAWPRHMILELAKAISGSPSWKIVDSYASNAGRIIGDPISGGLWNGYDQSTLGQDDTWFIAEQVNPRSGYAPMQIKFQGTGNANYNDPCGKHYRYDYSHTPLSSFRDMTARFSP
jgi:hypothetical protein